MVDRADLSLPQSHLPNTRHDPARPLDQALARLNELPPQAFLHCLGPTAESTEIPKRLLAPNDSRNRVQTDSHPLRSIAPSDHLAVHHAWLEATFGESRMGVATVRTTATLAPGSPHDGPPGTYHVELIDLIGAPDLDVVVAALWEATDRTELPGPDHLGDLAGHAGRTDLGFRTLAESLPVGVAVIDERGVVHFVNNRLMSVLDDIGILGPNALADARMPPDPEFSTNWAAVVDPRFLADVAPLVAPQAPGAEGPTSGQVQVVGDDGRTHHLVIQSVTIRTAELCRVIVSVGDVTEEVTTLGAHSRLRQVVDGVEDVVLVTNPNGVITFANQAARRFLGPDPEGLDISTLAYGQLRQFLASVIRPEIERHEPWAGDLELRDSDGTMHTMSTLVTPVADPQRADVQVGVTMRDVTRERSHARDLAQQARSDMLTGLPNRLALMEALEDRRRAGTPDAHVALFFIDLDHLKIVNDGLGHSAGDRLLVAVAHELAAASGSDVLARFGGDEFAIVAEGLSGRDLLAQANRYLAAVGRARVPGVASHLTASIGVASVQRRHLDPEALLRDADAAMYQAKRTGRGRAALFDDELREQASRRFLLGRELRAALDRGELDVHLQPIVSLHTGAVDGFEALCRWGTTSPGEFIPVAEESDLIRSVGHRVLEKALVGVAQLRAALPHLHDARVGVNVSARELDDPMFVDRVLSTIAGSDLQTDHVVLELTESVLIDPRAEVNTMLGRLRDAGVSLVLDDFGSGYSSLTYLRRYPIDVLKFDISYTQAMATDPETRIIVESLATMAARLGIEVVAEGVETMEQLQVARELDMTWAQGFLLGRPASVDDHLASLLPSRSGLLAGR